MLFTRTMIFPHINSTWKINGWGTNISGNEMRSDNNPITTTKSSSSDSHSRRWVTNTNVEGSVQLTYRDFCLLKWIEGLFSCIFDRCDSVSSKFTSIRCKSKMIVRLRNIRCIEEGLFIASLSPIMHHLSSVRDEHYTPIWAKQSTDQMFETHSMCV